MKKKILGVVLVAAMAAMAAFNINFNMNTDNDLSAISLANVEALASGEAAPCPNGCTDIGWGFHEIVRCDCTYTGIFSSCDSWGC